MTSQLFWSLSLTNVTLPPSALTVPFSVFRGAAAAVLSDVDCDVVSCCAKAVMLITNIKANKQTISFFIESLLLRFLESRPDFCIAAFITHLDPKTDCFQFSGMLFKVCGRQVLKSCRESIRTNGLRARTLLNSSFHGGYLSSYFLIPIAMSPVI